jgi:MYXO-CTERM domain-containing protein
MSTRIGTDKAGWLQILSAVAVLLAIGIALPGHAATGEGRASSSIHVVNGGRSKLAAGTETNDQYGALEIIGEQKPSKARVLARKSGFAASKSGSFDFWFYEADVVLFSDDDNDGYFYGIDLLFDVDTVYSSADVYAVAYLSLDGGPWNEYAVTEDFSIHGSSGSDEYVLVTELMSGYPTGSYDLLIELYDSFDGGFLTSFGPDETSELSFLPLEDFNRDAPVFDRPVAVSHGSGGGASGLWMLAMLLLAAAARFRKCGAA